MFQFPGFPCYILFIHICIPSHYQRWVPSFGYLRINVYLQLPAAFRSLSRPSSAPSAKASTLRSSSLNRIVISSLFAFLIRTSWKICFWFFPQQNIIFVNIVYYSLIFFLSSSFPLLEKTICSCQGTNSVSAIRIIFVPNRTERENVIFASRFNIYTLGVTR